MHCTYKQATFIKTFNVFSFFCTMNRGILRTNFCFPVQWPIKHLEAVADMLMEEIITSSLPSVSLKFSKSIIHVNGQ